MKISRPSPFWNKFSLQNLPHHSINFFTQFLLKPRKCYYCYHSPTEPLYWSNHPHVLLGKNVLKICNKFTGDHSCQSAISTKLRNFIEITLQHGCSLVNLMHIFRTLFFWELLWRVTSELTPFRSNVLIQRPVIWFAAQKWVEWLNRIK